MDNKQKSKGKLLTDEEKTELSNFKKWLEAKKYSPKTLDEVKKYYAQYLKEKKQMALHGAKLDYVKTLKHQCADDEELVYYKKGGKVDCGCKKKGGDIEPKKECGGGAVSKFKMARKAEDGTKFKKPQFKDEAARDSFYINVRGAEDLEATRPGSYKKNKNGKIQWTPDRTKAPYNKKKKENKQPVYLNLNMSNKKGGTIEKFKSARCGSKMKKHKLGGSLNGIPFMLGGTSKGGLKPIVLPEYKMLTGTPTILPGRYTGLEKMTPGLFQMFKTWVKGLPKTLTPMDYISTGAGATTGIGLGYDDTHNLYVRKWITNTEKSLLPPPLTPSKPFIEFIKNNKSKFKK